jgi:hypothetical protein
MIIYLPWAVEGSIAVLRIKRRSGGDTAIRTERFGLVVFAARPSAAAAMPGGKALPEWPSERFQPLGPGTQ